MIDNVNEYVDFLVKHKLSTNEFLLLQLLHEESMFKELGSNALKFKKIGNIYKWNSEGKGWSKDEVQNLIDKDYLFGIKSKQIINGKEEYTYAIDQLILTQKFSDIMFINSNFAFDEILELYPDTFNIQTQTVFTKSGDLDKVQQNYHKLIKGNILKHEEIKQIIIYAKERGLCNYKLENFLSKGVIDTIKKMMGETYGTGTDI
jgi:hypothetical protein